MRQQLARCNDRLLFSYLNAVKKIAIVMSGSRSLSSLERNYLDILRRTGSRTFHIVAATIWCPLAVG